MATTRKTAAPKIAPTPEPVEVDELPEPAPVRERIPVLDDPNPEAKTGTGTKPRYYVIGNTFYAQMEDGWELQAPIKLSVRTVKALQSFGSDDDANAELDQIVELFRLLGDEATVDKLMDADFADSMSAALAYFQAWEEKNEVRLGELRRSSR